MLLPEKLIGLHRFIAKGDKVILKTDDREVAELDFIRFLDHGGILRAKLKSIHFIGGKRKEVPLDIFVRDFWIHELHAYVEGVERVSDNHFSLNFQFKILSKEFCVSGIANNRMISIVDKDLMNVIQELMNEFS